MRILAAATNGSAKIFGRQYRAKTQLRENNLPYLTSKGAVEFLCIVDLTPTDDCACFTPEAPRSIGQPIAVCHPPYAHPRSVQNTVSIDLDEFDSITGLHLRKNLVGWMARCLPADPGQIHHVRLYGLIVESAFRLGRLIAFAVATRQPRVGSFRAYRRRH